MNAVNQAEAILRQTGVEVIRQGVGVAALPGEKLTVLLGDIVRVHVAVDYRGTAIDGAIWVSYGRQDTWFNEDGNKQSRIPVHFDQSIDWAAYEFACDVLIGGTPGSDYDLYAKLMELPGVTDIFSPTLLNVLDVVGAPEFQNFGITGYEVVT